MLKVGLSGNIGSGKSVVSKIFETLKIPVYRSDEEAKLILDKPEIIQQLVQTFTSAILDPGGKVERKKLASIVFNDSEKLSLLNGIIHPAVLADFSSWVAMQKNVPYVVMESAILFETGYNKFFDKIIVVTAPKEIRIQRVIMRDLASREEVEARIHNQMDDEIKKQKSDYVINNDGNCLIIPQVLEIHQKISSVLSS
jgi:dephospho-CoA kinase